MADQPALPAGTSRLCGADIIVGAMTQYANNFLLNDLDVEQARALGAHETRVLIPHVVPRRRHNEIERIHQSRVSLRRLRSTVRIFHPLLDEKVADELMATLSWYADELSPARDLTVLRERLLLDGPLIRSVAARELIETTLDHEIAMSLASVEFARGTQRYGALIATLAEISSRLSFTPLAYGSAKRVLVGNLDAPYRELLDAVRASRGSHDPHALHVVRIRAKRLQHGLELAAVVHGKTVHRTARAAERLQRRLGTVHDADVSRAWVAGLATTRPELAAHLDQIAEYERVAAKVARRGWREDVVRLRARWRAWH